MVDKKYIFLEVSEVYDEIKDDAKSVISADKISNPITETEFALQSISSGGQSRKLPPEKLLLKKGLLFTYSKEGTIYDKKQQSMVNGNIFSRPWYKKIR